MKKEEKIDLTEYLYKDYDERYIYAGSFDHGEGTDESVYHDENFLNKWLYRYRFDVKKMLAPNSQVRRTLKVPGLNDDRSVKFELGYYPSKSVPAPSKIKRTGKIYRGLNKGIEYIDNEGNRYVKVKESRVFAHRRWFFGHRDGYNFHSREKVCGNSFQPEKKNLVFKKKWFAKTEWYLVEPLKWSVDTIEWDNHLPKKYNHKSEDILRDSPRQADRLSITCYPRVPVTPIYPDRKAFYEDALIVPASLVKQNQQTKKAKTVISQTKTVLKPELKQEKQSVLNTDKVVDKEYEHPFGYTEQMDGPEMGM